MVAAGSISAATALHKDVILTLDDKTYESPGFALTVGDVLRNNGVELEPEDEVVPAPGTLISDGQEIEVRFQKAVTLVIDGKKTSFVTNDPTLEDALADVPFAETIKDAAFSVPQATPLPRDGVTVIVTTPKDITLKVAGKKTKVVTTASTVADLLVEQKLAMNPQDILSHTLDEAIGEGQTIALDRVELEKVERKEPISFEIQTRDNSKLWKGETRVIEVGKDGSALRTYEITKVNGKQKKSKLLSEVITRKPKTQVVEQGTKVSANGAGINLAREAAWNRIARCESGNNWKINTGNGYYGGLQFSKSSWNSNGGRDFAAYPHQATREQQITVANRYYAKAGFRPWSCKP
jgi:uncharacterized protein YabE (DUF348 family)